ncbi:MAG: LysR family transcriptional regulator [Paracoccaceae bacterium]
MARHPFDFRQLEALYWVARMGSFAAAARKLNTSQPAISQRISDLETGLGVLLFDRSRRRATLTPKGLEAVEGAEELLSLSAEMHTRLAKQESLSGLLRVGVNETIALSWLPELVQEVKQRTPNVVLEVHVGLTQTLWESYERGNLELLLVSGPIEEDGIVLESLGTTSYTWMTAPRSGLQQRTILPTDFRELAIITHGPGSTMHDDILDWFQRDETLIRNSAVCHSLSAMAVLTKAGLGVSMLPPIIYQAEVDDGKLIALDPKPALPQLEFWAVYPQRVVSPLPATISRFAQQVSTFRKRD